MQQMTEHLRPNLAVEGVHNDSLGSRQEFGVQCYYVAFGLFLAYMTLSWSNYIWVPHFADFGFVCKVIIVGLLLINLISRQNLVVRLFTMAPFLIVAFAAWRVSGYSILAWSVVMIAFSEGTEIKILARIAICVSIILLGAIALSAYTGIIETTSIPSRDGVRMRVSLGFIHPNRAASACFGVFLSLCALRYDKASFIPEILVFCLIFAVVALVFISRTVELMLIASLVFYIIAKKLERCSKQRFLSIAALIVFVVIVATSLILAASYSHENAALSNLNQLLSNRLSYAHYYFERYGVHAFGYDYSEAPVLYSDTIGMRSSENRFVVDNAFCHLLLRYGVVPFMLFCICICFVYILSIRRISFGPCLFGLTIMLIFGLSETNGFLFDTNYFLVIVTYSIVSIRNAYATRRTDRLCV